MYLRDSQDLSRTSGAAIPSFGLRPILVKCLRMVTATPDGIPFSFSDYDLLIVIVLLTVTRTGTVTVRLMTVKRVVRRIMLLYLFT
ncbi:hypothetical protein SAMN05216327_104266 [Dyadobacter sp. SG02]|nr:hypothetical protein SAMN05216327_104266 [Dyadobacter sp. SG02]